MRLYETSETPETTPVYRSDNEPLWLIVLNLSYQATIHCYHLLQVLDFDTLYRTLYRKFPFTVLVQLVSSATLSSTNPNRLIIQHRLSNC
jgi:hypothetical protein